MKGESRGSESMAREMPRSKQTQKVEATFVPTCATLVVVGAENRQAPLAG